MKPLGGGEGRKEGGREGKGLRNEVGSGGDREGIGEEQREVGLQPK